MIGRNVKEIDFSFPYTHTYLELLFLYFLYFIHSFFLFNIFKKEFTIFVQSLSLHKSFSIKLVWGAKKNLPKKLDRNKRQLLGLTKYLFMDGHYFFLSKKSPSNIDPCMAMSIFHNNTLVPLYSVKMSLRKIAN